MSKKDVDGIYSITLEESQLLFKDITLLRKFLVTRFNFNNDEIDQILSNSLEKIEDTLLIDLIYDTFNNLLHKEVKEQNELVLYDKVLRLLNYHIAKTNFGDKHSRFMKEFEHALLHYDEPYQGMNDDSIKRK